MIADGVPLDWGRTPRLSLREFVIRDHFALIKMHRDPRLRALLIDDYPFDDPRVSRAFLDRIIPYYRQHEGLGIWHATAFRPEPVFAGWFNLMPMPERPDEVEIGARLLPAVWGGGLAQEGGELLLDHALALNLPHVWGICHPDNRSAVAVLAAMGFESHGVQPYTGKPALWHRIDLNAWRELRNTPRATRLRQALRALATRRAGTHA